MLQLASHFLKSYMSVAVHKSVSPRLDPAIKLHKVEFELVTKLFLKSTNEVPIKFIIGSSNLKSILQKSILIGAPIYLSVEHTFKKKHDASEVGGGEGVGRVGPER